MVIRDNVVAGIVNEISAAPAALANLAHPHSTTSSARASSENGRVKAETTSLMMCSWCRLLDVPKPTIVAPSA
jgi:hypothetical protein